MSRQKVKKYAIHILAVSAIGSDLFDTPKERNAAIICTDRTTKFRQFFENSKTLWMVFPDVEKSDVPGAFNGAHARKIIAFLDTLPSEISDIYVCCSKGGSRSPAIAAALLRMSGRNDKAVWLNPYYVPNTLVYYKLCKESGVPVSRFYVKLLSLTNSYAYKRAKRKRSSGKYERWQILE